MINKAAREAKSLTNRRIYARAYYHARQARNRAYYKANKDKIKARSAAWKIANRESYLIQQARYDYTTRLVNRVAKQLRDDSERVEKDFFFLK